MTTPTIFALSSGAGRAGIAVIRVSGPRTTDILETFIGEVPSHRLAQHTTIRSARDGTVIDRGVVIFFPGPNSFTGEDVAEFQVHGSPAVVRRLLEELSEQPQTELATPGAFTERAFINGKLDLTEVEGLADLIDADTDLQRSQALAQSSGILRRRSGEWRSSLIHALALIEAVLDFSDESDVTDGPIEQALQIVQQLTQQIERAIVDTGRAEAIRNGLKVAIVGAPNAGKSSLLNALAARDVAIVTPVAGTTRDTIEVHLELAGLPVTLIDTAGLRTTDNEIEREGIARAHAAANEADLIIYVVDASTMTDTEPLPELVEVATEIWRVHNKIDLPTIASTRRQPDIRISATTGRGIEELIGQLTGWCASKVSSAEPAIVTRERQRQCLDDCLTALAHFADGELEDLELRAEDLRTAATALGRLTGEIDAEEVLDDIFAGFCIGK